MRLETAGNQFSGRPFEFVERAKFSITVLYLFALKFLSQSFKAGGLYGRILTKVVGTDGTQ